MLLYTSGGSSHQVFCSAFYRLNTCYQARPREVGPLSYWTPCCTGWCTWSKCHFSGNPVFSLPTEKRKSDNWFLKKGYWDFLFSVKLFEPNWIFINKEKVTLKTQMLLYTKFHNKWCSEHFCSLKCHLYLSLYLTAVCETELVSKLFNPTNTCTSLQNSTQDESR